MSEFKLSADAGRLIERAVTSAGKYWRDAGTHGAELCVAMGHEAERAELELRLYVTKLECEIAQHESEIIKRLDMIEKNTWALRGLQAWS